MNLRFRKKKKEEHNTIFVAAINHLRTISMPTLALLKAHRPVLFEYVVSYT